MPFRTATLLAAKIYTSSVCRGEVAVGSKADALYRSLAWRCNSATKGTF